MPKTTTKVDYTHAPLSDIDAAIASGKLTVEDAQAILEKRAKRDSKSGKRAASWLVSNGFATKTAVEATSTRSTTKRAKKARIEADEDEATLTPEQKREIGAKAKAHAEATVGYYTRVTRAQREAGIKRGDAKPGFRIALRAEFKRLAIAELANA